MDIKIKPDNNALRLLIIFLLVIFIFIFESVSVEAVIPQDPIPFEPYAGSAYPLNNNSYWLSWSHPQSGHSQVKEYRLAVRDITNSDTGPLIYDSNNTIILRTDTAFKIPGNKAGMLQGRTYRWCIMAVTYSNVWYYGEARTFRIESTGCSGSHYFTGGFSSVSNFTYKENTNSWGNIISAAAVTWNNVSPSVNVSSNSNSTNTVTVNTSSTPKDGEGAKILGKAEFFNNNTLVGNSSVCNKVTITMYHKNFSTTSLSGVGYNERFKAVSHEMGHALGLGHTILYSPLTIMNNVLVDPDNPYPNYIDRIHLRMKRGF